MVHPQRPQNQMTWKKPTAGEGHQRSLYGTSVPRLRWKHPASVAGEETRGCFFGSSLMFSDRILNLNSTIVYRCILQRTTEKLPMRITGLALGHSVWYPHGYRSHLFCPDMDVLCCSRWPASRWTYGNQYLDVYPSSKVGNSHIIPQQFRWVIQNPPTKIEKAS